MSDPLLSSWKEIAAFLQVDVKTAQRWEKTRGLPVRRPHGGQRGKVYASRGELEQWLLGARAVLAAEEGQTPEPDGIRPWMRWAGIAVAVVLAGAGIYASMKLRKAPAVSLAVEGRTLAGKDARGGTTWAIPLPGEPSRIDQGSPWSHWLRPMRWRAGEELEFVAALRLERDTGAECALLSLDAHGNRRWSWAPRIDLADFDGRPFEPEWCIGAMVPDETAGKERIWVAVVNPLRWASALYWLDRDGRATLQFGNAGSILQVILVAANPRPRLVIAGVNNAFSRAFIAEIDPDGPAGFSPPSNRPRYRFHQSLPGTAKRYILLPGSELHDADNIPYFRTRDLHVSGENVIVDVYGLTFNQSVFNYVFTSDLTPVRARVTSTGIGLHRSYEAKGILKHSAEQCPEFNEPHVLRIWEPERGWRDTAIPVASQANAN